MSDLIKNKILLLEMGVAQGDLKTIKQYDSIEFGFY